MNDIYSMNKLALSKRYPNLQKSVEKFTDKKYIVEIVDAKDNNKTMYVIHEGKTFYIHSKYAPVKEAYDWIKNLNFDRDSTILIFGCGLAYHIKELCRQICDHNRMLIVEPSIEIFHEALKYIDFTDIINHPNIILIVGDTLKEIEGLLWKYVPWEHMHHLRIASITNYHKLFPKEYLDFQNAIDKVMREEKLYKNTLLRFAKTWQRNLLTNIPYLVRSYDISSLFGIFQNKPVIIVSAGPSLSKNVEFLKDAKGKAMIICVGTALRTVINAGIEPDLIIAMDGGEINYRHFENIMYSDIPLVYGIKVFPEILQNHQGKKFVFYTEDGCMEKILKDLDLEIGVLACGGSVSNSAFDLAVKMGGNPIIFVGQDLAYTDGKTHAKYSIYEEDTIKDSENLLKVKDIYGKDIVTSPSLFSVLNWFENEIQKDKTERLYIDATEGGAYIEGTRIMPLWQVIREYCQNPVNIHELLNGAVENRFVKLNQYNEKVITKLKQIEDRIRGLQATIDEGAKQILKISEEKLEQCLPELDRINLSVKKQIDHLYILHYMLQSVFHDILNDEEFKKQESKQEIRRFHRIYREISKTLAYMDPLLKECIERIEKMSNKMTENHWMA
ncbi:motility associated factor glycosyltransferase family protein [Thermotalea metallivorans]|uniref:DUF115 domain-containing protein n=1 Tax=Thermotalea metallivorans TaxID=520762 RepID=A0A140L719_9FIRM|nr:6-hydroxymethylpterin diphosphokinase MptE-like protein [Thermotalea metallivorans]KXG76344.1 hypothetical protein AN619_13020 [Thermotalea metallivorans]